jgi:hypothetical protein
MPGKATFLMRHYPKTNGAVMAQISLLHHWKNPTHGDGAKPRAITPECSGVCNGAGTLSVPLRSGSALPSASLASRRSHLEDLT